MNRLEKLYAQPTPVRKVIGIICRRLRLLPYRNRVNLFFERRPHYAYGILHGAQLAKSLGINEISVIEFGVAGGNGLLNMEYHARRVEKITGIAVQIFGFDTGKGLPPPKGYKDSPYNWKEGSYDMNVELLKSRLSTAKIILGDVGETLNDYCNSWNPAPIAFIAHDFDFYSSTLESFKIFEVPSQYRLPRIFNYFDDILGTVTAAYNDYTGELAAIHEFNVTHSSQKIAPCQHFKLFAMQPWHHQFFMHHDFLHAQYDTFVSDDVQQLSLK